MSDEPSAEKRAIDVRIPVVVCQCGAHAVIPHWWQETNEPAANFLLCECNERPHMLYRVNARLAVPQATDIEGAAQ